jgi:hypothetical protein
MERVALMAIDWATEPYVRLYKRETDDDLLLSWEARAVWYEMLRKFDHSGVLETRRGVRGLAALVRVPLEVVERVLPELLEDGRVRAIVNRGFVAPNYVPANFTARSDKARQQESRLRRSADVLSGQNDTPRPQAPSQPVTSSHDESQPVTQISTDQDKTDQGSTDHQPPPAPPRAKPRKGIPESWQPAEAEYALARELGLDCDVEAREFKSFWLGDGRPKKNWDQTFHNRLLALAKHRRPNAAAGRMSPLLDRVAMLEAQERAEKESQT